MSNWARIETTVDVRIDFDKGETLQSVTRDICAGMADTDGADVRVINIRSREIKDA